MIESSNVLIEIKDRVAYLTLNRPEKRNALNYSLISDLKNLLVQQIQNDDVKVIVIKGSGKAFCSGADLEYLKRLQSFTIEENLADSNNLKELFVLIYRSPKMVIAMIQGHAIAGGCGLATACDFAFSIPEAKFGFSEVKIGFIPAIVMYFSIRKAGELRAKELLLSGKIVSAEKMQSYNLINEVIDADKIEDHVTEFAQMLCNGNSGESMAMTKKMISDLSLLPFENAMEIAAKMNAHARSTEDCKKGINAFLNKEKLVW